MLPSSFYEADVTPIVKPDKEKLQASVPHEYRHKMVKYVFSNRISYDT